MESLPKELIQGICVELSYLDLKHLILCNKLYGNIFGKFLEENRKKQLENFLKKYSRNDTKLIQILTTLFNSRFPSDDYYCILIPERLFAVPFDSRFLFFKGNFSRAIFKIADYLWSNTERWDGSGTQINLFYEVFNRNRNISFNNVNDIISIVDLFYDFKEGSEIGIDEFYYLPKIKLI